MNLENMYGTEESLMQVFERALQFNEPIKVFQQLVGIYVRTEKLEVRILWCSQYIVNVVKIVFILHWSSVSVWWVELDR